MQNSIYLGIGIIMFIGILTYIFKSNTVYTRYGVFQMEPFKANSNLKNMALVKLGRLSVQPVTDKEWEEVMKMSEGK